MKPRPIPRLTQREIDRFFQQVNRTDTCWIWVGYVRPDGYGHMTIRRAGIQRSILVHRIAYQVLKKRLSIHRVLDHQCRNKRCVNPGHLRAVTDRTNLLSDPATMTYQNKHKRYCLRGHPLFGKNLYVYPQSHHRCCRQCRNITQQRYLKRQAALTSYLTDGVPVKLP